MRRRAIVRVPGGAPTSENIVRDILALDDDALIRQVRGFTLPLAVSSRDQEMWDDHTSSQNVRLMNADDIYRYANNHCDSITLRDTFLNMIHIGAAAQHETQLLDPRLGNIEYLHLVEALLTRPNTALLPTNILNISTKNPGALTYMQQVNCDIGGVSAFYAVIVFYHDERWWMKIIYNHDDNAASYLATNIPFFFAMRSCRIITQRVESSAFASQFDAAVTSSSEEFPSLRFARNELNNRDVSTIAKHDTVKFNGRRVNIEREQPPIPVARLTSDVNADALNLIPSINYDTLRGIKSRVIDMSFNEIHLNPMQVVCTDRIFGRSPAASAEEVRRSVMFGAQFTRLLNRSELTLKTLITKSKLFTTNNDVFANTVQGALSMGDLRAGTFVESYMDGDTAVSVVMTMNRQSVWDIFVFGTGNESFARYIAWNFPVLYNIRNYVVRRYKLETARDVLFIAPLRIIFCAVNGYSI